MTTIRALSYLNTIIEHAERADTQGRALAVTFKNLVAEIDAVLNDADQKVEQVLTEKAVGTETRFVLLRTPVLPGSVKLFADGVAVSDEQMKVDPGAGVIDLATPVAKDSRVTVQYTVQGLRSQMEPLAAAVGITMDLVVARRNKYAMAAQWIEQNLS